MRPTRDVPPFISTGDPSSFAMRTIVERKPRIIQQVIDTNSLSDAAERRLRALQEEMSEGTVTSPFAPSPPAGSHGPSEQGPPVGPQGPPVGPQGPPVGPQGPPVGPQGPPIGSHAGPSPDPHLFDPSEWAAWTGEISKYSGRKWLDLPWYFAEAFFYLKLLVACGYYGDRPARAAEPSTFDLATRDPFAYLKERELVDAGGGLDLARRLAGEVAERRAAGESLAFLLHAALWGNRVDLSNYEIDETHRRGVLVRRPDSLLIDHTEQLLEVLRAGRQVHMILDNAGSELSCDLLVADRLLHDAGSELSITLHVKRAPFFVSDAMAKDARRTVEAFASDSDPLLSGAGKRLSAALETTRMRVSDHWFWNSALHFTALPADLRQAISAADVVIIKGDANYRRILEDRRWDSSLRMEDLAGYFPAPFAVLRTMKSEIVVDIPRNEARRLSASDPEWLTNGRRGLIRFCCPK